MSEIESIVEYFACLWRPSVFCGMSEIGSILEYFACLPRGPPSAGICLVRSASCRLGEAGAADTREENVSQLEEVKRAREGGKV